MRLSGQKKMEMYSHRTTLPPKNMRKEKPSYKVYPRQNRSEQKQKRDPIKTKKNNNKRLDPYTKKINKRFLEELKY